MSMLLDDAVNWDCDIYYHCLLLLYVDHNNVWLTTTILLVGVSSHRILLRLFSVSFGGVVHVETSSLYLAQMFLYQCKHALICQKPGYGYSSIPYLFAFCYLLHCLRVISAQFVLWFLPVLVDPGLYRSCVQCLPLCCHDQCLCAVLQAGMFSLSASDLLNFLCLCMGMSLLDGSSFFSSNVSGFYCLRHSLTKSSFRAIFMMYAWIFAGSSWRSPFLCLSLNFTWCTASGY